VKVSQFGTPVTGPQRVGNFPHLVGNTSARYLHPFIAAGELTDFVEFALER
jgi:hypothetical protein